jgi:NAD(P)H-hydrate epimerase
MGGAAALCASSALRAGAGLVTVAAPESIRTECAVAVREAMTLGLGDLSRRTLEPVDVDLLLEATAARDAGALGPGLGRSASTGDAARALVRGCTRPLVLDADGLTPFTAGLESLRGRIAPTVLTPHPGELGRLFGTSAAEVQEDRLAAARRAAAATGAVVVLKGHQTLVAEPPGADGAPGAVWITPTGNPGMASGGTGDVLSGVLGALIGWIGGVEAVGLGVFVHGLAGDLAAATVGETGLAASDVAAALPPAFRALPDLD